MTYAFEHISIYYFQLYLTTPHYTKKHAYYHNIWKRYYNMTHPLTLI